MKKILKGILNYIKENLVFLICLLLIIVCFTYKLPYTVEYPGGLISLEPRLKGEIYKSKGSFNLTYVSNVPGYISNLILAKIIPDWDIIKNDDITYDGETMKMHELRSRIDLYSSISAAKYVAYMTANIEPNITKEYNYVYYVTEDAETDLFVGDLIDSYDDIDYEMGNDLVEYIQSKNIGDTITFKVKDSNEKEVTRTAKIFDDEGTKRIGVYVQSAFSYDNTPNIQYLYNPEEYGPSGGLMMSLAMYNALIEEDITKGLKISGTGTINHDGTVGAIGGVKYKLAGAINNKSDVFIVPEENYEEALEVAKSHKSNIKIIKATTFTQVIADLNKL